MRVVREVHIALGAALVFWLSKAVAGRCVLDPLQRPSRWRFQVGVLVIAGLHNGGRAKLSTIAPFSMARGAGIAIKAYHFLKAAANARTGHGVEIHTNAAHTAIIAIRTKEVSSRDQERGFVSPFPARHGRVLPLGVLMRHQHR